MLLSALSSRKWEMGRRWPITPVGELMGSCVWTRADDQTKQEAVSVVRRGGRDEAVGLLSTVSVKDY